MKKKEREELINILGDALDKFEEKGETATVMFSCGEGTGMFSCGKEFEKVGIAIYYTIMQGLSKESSEDQREFVAALMTAIHFILADNEEYSKKFALLIKEALDNASASIEARDDEEDEDDYDEDDYDEEEKRPLHISEDCGECESFKDCLNSQLSKFGLEAKKIQEKKEDKKKKNK